MQAEVWPDPADDVPDHFLTERLDRAFGEVLRVGLVIGGVIVAAIVIVLLVIV